MFYFYYFLCRTKKEEKNLFVLKGHGILWFLIWKKIRSREMWMIYISNI